jgi:hypothetical protein
MRKLRLALFAVAGLTMLIPAGASAEAKKPTKAKHVLDLADVSAGTYFGDVISESRGSSQSDVTITVAKTGPNTVRVSSSYPRLPTFSVHLTRAMQTIQQASGDNVFLIDQAKSPWSLDVTVDGASWSGTRR